MPLLRVEVSRHAGGILDVREEHGYTLALALQSRTRAEHSPREVAWRVAPLATVPWVGSTSSLGLPICPISSRDRTQRPRSTQARTTPLSAIAGFARSNVVNPDSPPPDRQNLGRFRPVSTSVAKNHRPSFGRRCLTRFERRLVRTPRTLLPHKLRSPSIAIRVTDHGHKPVRTQN